MGKGYELSALVLLVLAIPQFTSVSQYVSALVLAAMAKHRTLAYIALAEGVSNLVLSIVLVRKIGLMGVAWGTVIPHLISTGLVIPWYTLTMLKMSPARYVIDAFVRPFLCALPTAALCYALSVLVVSPSRIGFALEVAAVCGSFAALSYFICLTGDQRTMLAGKLGPATLRTLGWSAATGRSRGTE
jgi:O-antigen/teichoic acid export membrane protein